MTQKAIIYQVLPRLFGNLAQNNEPNGDIQTNGCGKFNRFTDEILQHFRSFGVTHMWYTGIIEHATETDYSEFGIVKDFPEVVKGRAGSPYAIKDYYDVDPDLAEEVPNRMHEFEALVHRTHQAGLKVVIDFIPNHLARQYQSDAKPEGVHDFGEDDYKETSFNTHNNFYYLPGTEFRSPELQEGEEAQWKEVPARATGNDCFSPTPGHHDWYETVKLNYGIDPNNGGKHHFDPIPDTWQKMRDVLLYWARKGVDGFRCDMAAMVPVEFWDWCIKEVKHQFPHLVFIAEVYQPVLYERYIHTGGFDWLYDKVGFYDSMIGVLKGERPASDLTKGWAKIERYSDNMLFFLENHDEMRLASDFMLKNGCAAIPGFIMAAAFSRNPLMFYFGQEIGEPGMDQEGFSGLDGRTTIFDYWSVPSIQRYYKHLTNGDAHLQEQELALKMQYERIIQLINEHEALNTGHLYDLMWCNHNQPGCDCSKIYTWLRFSQDEIFLLAVNFSDEDQNCRIRIPEHAFQVMGVDEKKYFRGRDLLTNKMKVQFPGEVAYTSGCGMALPARSGAIIKLW